MNAKPILFSGDMVRAILEGRKTQTRRIIKSAFGKNQPIVNLKDHGGDDHFRNYSGKFNDPDSWGYPYAEDGCDMALSDWIDSLCPYGTTNDVLWVRENFSTASILDQFKPSIIDPGEPIHYEADSHWRIAGCRPIEKGKVRPNIFMPQWASRLTLAITDIRVERLHDISEEDAWDEGIYTLDASNLTGLSDEDCKQALRVSFGSLKIAFNCLWESINSPESWAANPWVWVIDFIPYQVNVDAYLEGAL